MVVVGTVFLITAAVCFFILRSIHSTELQKEIHSWIGYKLNFPDDIQMISGDSSMLHKPYKILIYIDDEECTSCSLKLWDWNDMYEKVFNIIVPDKLSIIILFDGREKEDILMHVRHVNWEMPVLWDQNGVINQQRKFPKQIRMRCMLLDSDNKVLVVGNPLYSHSIYDLYLKLLTKKIEDNVPIN